MSSAKTSGKTAAKPKAKTTKSTKAAPKTTKTTKTKIPVAEKVIEKVSPVKRARRVVDRETIMTDFERLLSTVDGHIGIIRESSKSKSKSSPITITSLKAIVRQLKQLRTDVNKNIKIKRKSSTGNLATSGFQKPVAVTSEMSKFAGWTSGDLHSRVEVTKSICNYIKDNNLQNPEDRRQIKPDGKLSKLLRIKVGSDPLTYYSLQKHIQIHFVKSK